MAGPKGRLQLKKGKQKVVAKSKESVKDLRERFMTMDAEQALKTLSDAEIKQLLAVYTEMTAAIKTANKELKHFKELLMESAQEDEWLTLQTKLPDGRSATAIITPSTETEMGTTREFAQILRDEGKFHLLDDLTKVKLTDAKKILGEDALSDFISTTTEKYGKVTLKLE